MKLKLMELLWELCPNCNKNCKYCGSKDTMNKFKELPDVQPVIDEILAYPPEEITLTGGEPAISIHFETVVTQLSAKIPVKVVSNGTIFKKPAALLNKLEQIGFSVNTAEDMSAMGPTQWTGDRNKVTMITNFGTHNIWQFSELHDYFVAQRWGAWQVQLTMGEYQLAGDGIDFLRGKLFALAPEPAKSMQSPVFNNSANQTIILADCLQIEHDCSAGINSASITWDGHVIPCLSMRAWEKDITEHIQGNLFAASLKDIWETAFANERFGCSKSCRDCIKYNPQSPPVQITWLPPTITKIPDSVPNSVPPERIYTKYGVGTPMNPMPNVQAYAVSSPWNEDVYVYGTWSKKS